jgi:nitroreductase
MDLLDLIRSRRSVRKFKNLPVEREKILICVNAARYAPSAEHSQPWRFLIIDDEKIKDKFVKQAFSGVYRMTMWAAKAPVLVVVLAELDLIANRIGKQITGLNYYLIDVGIAGEHFVLQAQELGLGSCWIGWFSAKSVRKALNIPKKYRPVSIIALGYSDVIKFKNKVRKDTKDMCWFNSLDNSK